MYITTNERHEWRDIKCIHCGESNVFSSAETYCKSPRVTGAELSLDELRKLVPGFDEKVIAAYEIAGNKYGWSIKGNGKDAIVKEFKPRQ